MLRAALTRGEMDAALDLGEAFLSGAACERSPERGLGFLGSAADAKVDGAALALGTAYLASDAPWRDRTEAVHWLSLALHRGNRNARAWLDWAIAGVEPPLRPEELAEIRGLQILLDGGGYDLPEGTPPKPDARRG
jgi:TPR repeat protein